MVGIIGAMDKEIELIKNMMSISRIDEIAGRSFYLGRAYGRQIVLVQAGIGKVNASITTTLLLQEYDIDYVINTGCAGGLLPAKQCDLIISNGCTYHDAQCFDYLYGQIPDMPHIYRPSEELSIKAEYIAKKLLIPYQNGIIATGDTFVTDKSLLDNVSKDVEGIIACDMEASAIAQTCFVYNKPFIILRMISDVVDSKEQLKAYTEIVNQVCENAARFVLEIIK